MADSGDVKRCCTELDKHKESLAKRANHYGVKSIVPPHDPKLNVMVVDVEDLGKAVESSGACSLCRCYKSKKFPYCDGSHNSHNEGTGDNAGPIVILPEGTLPAAPLELVALPHSLDWWAFPLQVDSTLAPSSCCCSLV